MKFGNTPEGNEGVPDKVEGNGRENMCRLHSAMNGNTNGEEFLTFQLFFRKSRNSFPLYYSPFDFFFPRECFSINFPFAQDVRKIIIETVFAITHPWFPETLAASVSTRQRSPAQLSRPG